MTMDLQACTAAVRERMGSDSGLDAVLKFDCGADGVIVLDGRATPNTVDNDDRTADCTIVLTLSTLEALLAGEIEPMTGFMSGKFKVLGDMGVGGGRAPQEGARPPTPPPPPGTTAPRRRRCSASASCAASSTSRRGRCASTRTRVCWRRGA